MIKKSTSSFTKASLRFLVPSCFGLMDDWRFSSVICVRVRSWHSC